MPENPPVDVNCLSCKSSDNPHLHSDSASTQRGRVMSFIMDRKEVTHQELVQEFGQPYSDAALEGLFDRCQIDFGAGKYFISPEDQWRRSTPNGFRYGTRHLTGPLKSWS